MPTFSFRGFTGGSSVALSAAQGGNSASGSVTTWGQGNVGSLGILTVAPGVVTAPAGIWLEAVDIAGFAASGGPGPGEVYDPSYHEITFIWTVNGQPLAPYQAPQNMVTGWNNPNVAYGKKVAFHFPDPGTYQIDLWAVDRSGGTGNASTTIVVTDADSLYPGTNTVCYSNDPGETWAGEKPGCQRATSFSALQSAINAATGPLRILFRRGQTVSEDTRLQVSSGSQWLSHVGAWGSGAKPVLVPRRSGFLFEVKNTNPVTQFTIADIRFQGGWDAASETGLPGNTPFYWLENLTDCLYTVSRCEFDGMENVWFSTRDSAGIVIVADCVATNWRDYGTYIHGSPNQRFALIGSRFQQNVDAQNGNVDGAGKNGFYNDHGPVRITEMKHAYIACCDLFSRNGWSVLGPDNADQPCLRLNSRQTQAGNSLIVERCVCEGGYKVVTMEGHDGSIEEYPGNFLLDRVLMIASAKTYEGFVTAEYGGTTIRNCIGIVADVPAYHPNGWEGAFKIEAHAPVAGNLDAPMQVYGNTLVNLRSAANDPGDSWPVINQLAAFTTVTQENNVLHAPGIDTPVAPHAIGLATDIPGVTPRYKGVLYNPFGQEEGTLPSSVPDGGSFTLPYPAGTAQAYWLAIQGTDTRHRLKVSGTGDYHAELGEISVAFEGSVIRITNASGEAWPGGAAWTLKLDRTSQKSAIPATHANPATLPLPRPQAAVGSGLGLLPHDDFEMVTRTGSAGALEL